MIAEATVYGSLVNRLRLESWWAAHPELADETIEAPIVVVGMSIHHDPPDAPVECNTRFAGEFASSLYWTTFFVPSYFRWTLTSGSSSHYDFHRRQLAVLQSRAPGRWNLKGPQHGLVMRALRERYPDAAIVVTHRDPAVCTASTASLISHLNGITSGSTDPVVVGALTTDFMSRCPDGLIADAEQYGDDGMIHVSYPEFVADPMRVIEDVYRRLDRDLSDEPRRSMCALIADRPQHKHGVHRYAMGDFGLNRAELGERFKS